MTTGETERALRAVAAMLETDALEPCQIGTQREIWSIAKAEAILIRELLPLFNAGIAGAYAAAAKVVDDYELLDGKDFHAKYYGEVDLAPAIRALTPADARHTSQPNLPLSEDVIKHRAEYPKAASDAWRVHKATPEDIIELIRWELADCMYSSEPEAPKNGQKVDSWHAGACALRAFAMTLKLKDKLVAAIASAEARARLDELEWLWGKDFGDAYNGGYLNERGRELLLKRMAAARTPDSTKEPE